MRIVIATIGMLTMVVYPPSSAGADQAALHREEHLKAAYLFNFVKFIEWPASVAADVLIVCFVGGEGVYGALASGIENKRAGARHLAARQLQNAATGQGCNAIYVDATAAADGAPLAAVSGLPILLVSDARDFALGGGMIELFADHNRLRFKINLGNVQKAGLRVSSSLLQVAAAIENGGGK